MRLIEKGVQCEHYSDSTDKRCRSRAFASVYVTYSDVGMVKRELWYCGAHQHYERKRGRTLTLVRKWEAGT